MVKSAEMLSKISDVLKKVGTQKELAEKVGVTQQAASNWLSTSSASIPSAESLIRLGLLAGSPDCFWFWQQAGVNEEEMLRVAQKISNERGMSLSDRDANRVKCFLKTAEGVKPVSDEFPIPARPVGLLPNPLSTVCLIVDESAANPSIPAGARIVLDESDKDVPALRVYAERYVLVESSAVVGFSPTDRTFARKFGSLYMGWLRFKVHQCGEDETGDYSITWVAVIDASADSNTWRPGDPGTQIGQWTCSFGKPPGDSPEGQRQQVRFQEKARRQALIEMRPGDGVKVLGEVRCFWPPSEAGR
jgi:transcriptional regulator with XRE-family HTH domain